MASARQHRLAALLAEGRDGVSAMLEAGWPQTTAAMIGPWAREYVRRAGLDIPESEPAELPTPPSGRPAELPIEPTPTPEPDAVAPELAPTAGPDEATDHTERPEGRRKRST